jgi:hypothetical protein
MTNKRKTRLRKMTFLNTHRLSETNEDNKYQVGKEFIDKRHDYFITISSRVARGSLRP